MPSGPYVSFRARERSIRYMMGVPSPVRRRISWISSRPNSCQSAYLPSLPPVEGPVRHLLQQIPLVSVKVDAVEAAGFGVRRGLSGIFDDSPKFPAGQRPARNLGNIEIRVPGRGDRQL